MDLNSLLHEVSVDPASTLVLRHRPREPELRRVLPWLAAEQPAVYNAYQQWQTPKVEKQLCKASHLVSLIGSSPARALFVGIYEVRGNRLTSRADRRKVKSFRELEKYGLVEQGGESRQFDLRLTDHFQKWSGKLVLRWPPPEIAWSRWAKNNEFGVHSIFEESALTPEMPDWRELVFTWNDLHVIPTNWRSALSEWRGVYFILDVSDGQGYVGSAYGNNNIRGRWENYAKSGHGGNKGLKLRKPENLRFSILERVSPDTSPESVIRLESSWKDRLHTRKYGLNEN
ncbi:MAG: GIY-YIG nuclease family protein [Planctomycetota bacterium]|nr:GIY-YIG nuclease family protein [Planctomycetota bacterium]